VAGETEGTGGRVVSRDKRGDDEKDYYRAEDRKPQYPSAAPTVRLPRGERRITCRRRGFWFRRRVARRTRIGQFPSAFSPDFVHRRSCLDVCQDEMLRISQWKRKSDPG